MDELDSYHTGATLPETSDVDGPFAAFQTPRDDSSDEATYEVVVKEYHLRPQRLDPKAKFTRTWLDQDDSGNYGERIRTREAHRPRNRHNRVERQNREDPRVADDNFDGEDSNSEGPAEVIPELMVMLKFQTEDAKTRFKDFYVNFAAQQQVQSDEIFQERKLRSRSAIKGSLHYSDINFDKYRNEAELPDDLTGWPAARGCWECLLLGFDCPLLDDGQEWPCTTCKEDKNDCTLVTPPEFKRTCERCKRLRVTCSYTYTLDHGEACHKCMVDGSHCVAGPAKGSIPIRIRAGRDYTIDPLPKQTSPRSRIQAAAALRIPNGDEPIARRDPTSLKPDSRGEKRRPIDSSPTPNRPVKTRKVLKDTQTNTIKIRTKFCHPICFNYKVKPGVDPCHLCENPLYAIIGLPSKEAEVVEWEDGRGLLEIKGGNEDAGWEHTRVCVRCTMERAKIIDCLKHELRPITGMKRNTLDFKAAFQGLIDGLDKANKTRWCALCPRLALHECCAASEDRKNGCGLELCEQCAVMLTKVYDGDLQRMLPQMKDKSSEEGGRRLRADYELLMEDGLLMRYVLWRLDQKEKENGLQGS